MSSSRQPSAISSLFLRITHHVLRFTFYVLRFTFFTLLLTPWPVQSVAAATPAYRVERGFSLPIGGEGELALSGSLLLWQETTAHGLTRLDGIDLRTNRRLPLPAPRGSQRQPALAGPLAAWIEVDPATEQPQVVVYDLDGHQRTVVTGPTALPDRPALDGTTVVWRDRRGADWGIYGYDLVAGAEFVLAEGDVSHGPPAIAGSHVVWQEYRSGSWDVYAYDLKERRARAVAGGPGDQVNPRVSGGRVVYEDRPADGGPPLLKVTDVQGSAPLTITQDHLVAAPAIAGQLLVWEDWRDGVAGIFAYDLERKVEVPVTRSEQARRPVVDGATVAWLNVTAFGTVVATAALQPTLPTERRDPLLKPDPNVIYFAETGHTLGFGFKSFWQQHGGLPVFGYPLTEELREPDPATGQLRAVQYFERFKLEHNPSEPDPARQVQVARLGVEWLAGRQPPPLPPIADQANRRYFPETGHTLAAGFKEYWDTHDGIRLLGFPIGEEMQEHGRTVQYFERGRLELDPTIEDPRVRIAPGQLGRDVLVARRWLPGAPPERPRTRLVLR